MKLIGKYHLVRFRPYIETGEFVNVGVILFIPELSQFTFKILGNSEHQRVTQFFNGLNPEIYFRTLEIIRADLTNVTANPKRYETLILPRDDIIQYSSCRVLFLTDPDKTINTLFNELLNKNH